MLSNEHMGVLDATIEYNGKIMNYFIWNKLGKYNLILY